MTLYGWPTPTASFTPMVGMNVQAWADGQLCGEGVIQLLANKLAYVLNADSDCEENLTSIWVDEQEMAQQIAWDNTQAWYLPLWTGAALLEGLTIEAQVQNDEVQLTAGWLAGSPSELVWQIDGISQTG